MKTNRSNILKVGKVQKPGNVNNMLLRVNIDKTLKDFAI